MKAVIFGTGMLYQRYKRFFSDVKILCFLDNDETKWGKQLDGSVVVSPKRIHEYAYDYIFLVSVHFREMRAQLAQLGVPLDRVIDWEHLGVFKYITQVRRYETNCSDSKKRKKKGKVLCISHTFDLSGAPVVLGRLAKVFQEEGYYVEIYSQDCGNAEDLLYQMMKAGISVSLYSRIELLDIDTICDDFDLIVVSTVTLYSVVQNLSGRRVPVIWWLHEEDDVYQNRQFDLHKIRIGENVHVYAGGERAKIAYQKYVENSQADILLYGLEETQNDKADKEYREKLIFALIGGGCERKGQDVVYEAVKRHFVDWNSQIEVWFVGEISETKQKEYEATNCIKCLGVMNPDELKEAYEKFDVLLCPSLHDPMPVVVSEAMMHKKTCIVSDMTGQYGYISPQVNGLTCEAGNVESLETAIQWAIDNRGKLEIVGKAGYRIYQNYFSMESFRKKAAEIAIKYIPDREKQ